MSILNIQNIIIMREMRRKNNRQYVDCGLANSALR